MDPAAISSLLADAGPWVLLVVSLMTGWLVPKWVKDDLKAERDFWKEQAIHLSGGDTDRVASLERHFLEREKKRLEPER